MIVRKVSKEEAFRLILKYHYSKVMPKLTKVCLGGFQDNKMVAIITLGWGVRPLHTIRKLFPSLTSKDYYEIGKMCLTDEMPHNSESHFLSLCMKWVKRNLKHIKLIFTWADGMLGKPGYVYQASNFLYGGYIWTDTYLTDLGEKVHPRATQKKLGGDKNLKYGHRPTKKQLKDLGWSHYRGKQFRYIYFLCGQTEKTRLMKETVFQWNLNHPKHDDLEWKKMINGKWEPVSDIPYNPDVMEFNTEHKNRMDWYNKHRPTRRLC